MTSVQLLGLEVRRFQAFERAELRFDRPGLTLLRGENEDTGGGSAAGKSTVGRAISYALGYCRTPATALVRWDSDGPMLVELALRVGEDTVVITRSPGKLRLLVNGMPQEGSITALEEQLAQLLGAKPGERGVFHHRWQRERGTFLTMGDVEARAVLAGPLGVEAVERGLQETIGKVRALEFDLSARNLNLAREEGALAVLPLVDVAAADYTATVAAEQHRLAQERRSTAEQCLGAMKATIASQREAEAVPLRQQIEALNTRLANPSPELVAAVVAAEALLAEVDRREAVARQQDEKRRDELRIERAKLVTQHQRAFAALASLQERLPYVQREHDAMTGHTCPTCLRAWPELSHGKFQEISALCAHLNQSIAQKQEELAQLSSGIDAWDLQHPDLPDPALARYPEVRGEAAHRVLNAREAVVNEKWRINQEVERLRGAMLAQLMQGETQEVALLTQAVQDAIKAEVLAHTSKVSAEQALAVAIGQHKARAAQEELLAKVVEAKAATEALLAKETDLEALLRAFGGAYLEDVLREVGDRASELLAGVANARHLTVAFRSEKTTAKGDTKSVLTPVVGIGRRELVGRVAIRDGISGGQASVVELAVDLAVLLVLEQRTGVRWGWLVLDEPFDGLGPVEKEGAIELLRQVSTDRVILVTDHASESAGLIEDVVTVRHSAGVSSLLR